MASGQADLPSADGHRMGQSCRSGTTTEYFSGDNPESLARVANLADGTMKVKFPRRKTIMAEDGYVFTAPVGKFPANHFGLHDMHGNVVEWLWDCSAIQKLPKQSDAQNPPVPDERGRWIANGSFLCEALNNLPSYRAQVGTGSKGCKPTLGFRVVCVPGGAP